MPTSADFWFFLSSNIGQYFTEVKSQDFTNIVKQKLYYLSPWLA